MEERPLSVAISALIKDKKILLIKRTRGDYIGLWGLPGGKIEKNEHVSEAAIREIKEESGIESNFKKHLGIVSEHLMEEGTVIKHFLLHICELTPKTINISNNEEGQLKWFELEGLEKIKNRLIPSDYLMIKKMILNCEGGYFNCIVEKSGEDHILKKFI